jgi:hypothetical protein
MTWGRKSRQGLCALAAATFVLAVGAVAPAAATPPGVDEYQLNLPDGGGGGSTTEPEASEPAPATTTPTAPTVAPTVPVAPTTEAPVVPTTPTEPPDKPKHHRVVIHGSTSPNAKLGPQEIAPLKVHADEQGTPWAAIGLAILFAACVLIAAWRLRYLRELPTAPGPKPAAQPRPRRTPSARPTRPATGATSGT